MKFFYSPGAVSLATLIALCEIDADFDPICLDFASKEQTKPEYLAINPKGRVPALITQHGTLTETFALLTYIAEITPSANLIPSDPYLRAKMNEMFSYLASTVHINHAHKHRGHRWADTQSAFDEMTAKVPETMLASFALIEEALETGPWIMGDQYTIADAHLFTISTWLEGDGVDITTLPNVVAYQNRMNARPAVQKAFEIMS